MAIPGQTDQTQAAKQQMNDVIQQAMDDMVSESNSQVELPRYSKCKN